ncbi:MULTISPECIES: N-6 DNA methylase [Bacillus cereus group]|uniref:N-6 DNA methylase n=1 Tax=Bacillus cereus group TaxID=86661 RepID=UPI00296E7109|nr:N-6 DNA methylase [Bacillus cereus]MDW4539401.1 N-6 DNA methylase [Bacillus cereus]
MQKVEKLANSLVRELQNGVMKENEVRNVVSKTFFVHFLLMNEKHSFEIPGNMQWIDLVYATHNVGKKFQDFFYQLEILNPILKNVIDSEEMVKVADVHFVDMLRTFNNFSLTKEQLQDHDCTGIYFESLIQMFVHYEGRKSGDYFTPPCLNQLLIKLLNPVGGTLYDGVMGIAGIGIEGKRSNNDLQFFGQELNRTYREIAYINCIVHGLDMKDLNLKLGNTLLEPGFLGEDGELKKFDYIAMNPPFSLRLDKKEVLENRWLGGLLGASGITNGDLAFLQHIVSSLKHTGKAAVIMAHGVLVRGGAEQKFRHLLLKEDWIETVISLPSKIMSNTAIPISILIFNKNKAPEKRNKIQFIVVEEGTELNRYQTVLSPEEIENIVIKYHNFENNGTDARVVDVEDIYENSDNLNPKVYFAKHTIESQIGTVTVHMDKYENQVKKKINLKHIADVKRGVNLPAKSIAQSSTEKRYKVIQLKDVQEDKISFSNLETLPIKNIDDYIVQAGDIIIASRGTAFKVAIVPEHEGTVILSNMFIRIRLKDTMSYKSEYVKAFLESPIGMFLVEATQKGTTVKVITPKDIENIEIPALTIKEQLQLVEHLTEMKQKQQELQRQMEQLLTNGYREAYELMGIQSAVEIEEK